MNIYEIKSTTWRCSDTISYKNYSFFGVFFFFTYIMHLLQHLDYAWFVMIKPLSCTPRYLLFLTN